MTSAALPRRTTLLTLRPAVRWLVLIAVVNTSCRAAEHTLTEIKRFDAPEARQAVAVDATHFYAITNSRIGKYDRRTGQRVALWEASDEFPLKHLNSGIVKDGRLIAAHSNYPAFPEASSVEVWDTATMKHVDSRSLGIYEGSLTWVDRKDEQWWMVFAHYSKKVNENPAARSSRWTSLVRFGEHHQRTGAWVFPDEVVERFEPNSCSGGAWGPDGALYCTGHDHGEVYRLTLPKAGSTLKLTATLEVPFTGQGIAWDPDGKHLWGIDRPKGQVIVCRFDEAE